MAMLYKIRVGSMYGGTANQHTTERAVGSNFSDFSKFVAGFPAKIQL
jgi:hypothetical protein